MSKETLIDCRVEFEKWFKERYGWERAPEAKTNASWQAWQAAWELIKRSEILDNSIIIANADKFLIRQFISGVDDLAAGKIDFSKLRETAEWFVSLIRPYYFRNPLSREQREMIDDDSAIAHVAMLWREYVLTNDPLSGDAEELKRKLIASFTISDNDLDNFLAQINKSLGITALQAQYLRDMIVTWEMSKPMREMSWVSYPGAKPRLYGGIDVSYQLLFYVKIPGADIIYQGYYNAADDIFIEAGDKTDKTYRNEVVAFMHYPLPKIEGGQS